MNEPRALTPKEVRTKFLDHIHAMVDYWLKEDRQPDVKDKLDGLAFSILADIDGSSFGLPAFDLVARPHPDDKAYLRGQGENWIEDGTVINADCHLHEFWHHGEKE